MNTIRFSKGLDVDHAQCFVRPDLGPNCLQRLSADDKRIKYVDFSVSGERPFRCAVCGRNFVSVGVLRSHLRTHSGVKEFKCNVCGARFTTNGSLTRHMNIHINQRLLQCSYCDLVFRTDFMLQRHLKLHTSGKC